MDYNIPCIKGESNPRRVDGNDPGYHYPINALWELAILYTVYIICLLVVSLAAEATTMP